MRVKIVRGAETFSPVQYNPFVIGPFEMELDVPDGTDPTPAVLKVRAFLNHVAEQEFEAQLVKHLERIKLSAERANTMGRR